VSETKVVVLAGKKQSGKSAATNFITGYYITQLGRAGIPYMPTRFTIDQETGELIVGPINDPSVPDQDLSKGEHVLDLNDKAEDVQMWLADCVHPYVKPFAFADLLKATATAVFGIPHELVNGTNEDKNKKCGVKWKDMCSLLPARTVGEIKKAGKYDEYMSAREFLQYFGTNVCRKLYDKCWVQSCFNRIEAEAPKMAVISDARFENEVRFARKQKAKVIKLTRDIYQDSHASETGLDKLADSNYDLIIPPDVDLREQNQLILEAMHEWEWFEQHIGLETDNG
jgi:hypothetical protein